MAINVEFLGDGDDGFEEAKAQSLAWLDEHAHQFGVVWNQQPFVLRSHRDGEIVGVLYGYINLSWLHVSYLATHPEARRSGDGKALMARAEAYARSQQCVGIWLDTYDFQGPDYYPRLGYAECGRIEDFPPGRTRLFFSKRL